MQLRSGLSREKNMQAACAFIAEAAAQGAQFIATPEMTNIVDRKGARLLSVLPEQAALEEIEIFADAARTHSVWLLIGSLAIKAGDKAVNRSCLFAPDGALVAQYDKLHMFDVDLPGGESWKESALYSAGNKAVVVSTPLATFGLSICYDLRFPLLYRKMAQAGAEILLAPAAFTAQTGRAHWRALILARAIENGAFVIAPAQGGLHEDGRQTYGHSMIVGPWGDILAESDNNSPGIIIADINREQAAEARRRIPNLSLEQNFKISIVDQ